MKLRLSAFALIAFVTACAGSGGLSSLAPGAIVRPGPPIVGVPTGSPTPGTPAPSLYPLTVNPASLDIGNTDPTTATFTVAEQSYNGSISVNAATCSGIATVSSLTVHGPQATISVTQSQPLTSVPPLTQTVCTIVLNDGNGQSAFETVYSTYFGVIIYAKHS